MEDLEYVCRQETFLDKAEKMLFDCLYDHIRKGEYEQAEKVVGLLAALTII